MNRPLFSILHTSARPDKWRQVFDAWMGAAVDPSLVEYVLCVDGRWGFSHDDLEVDGPHRVVWNEGRRCYVDGVNTAAAAATGQILIVNADDQFPALCWDESLIQVLDKYAAQASGAGSDPAQWPDGVFSADASLWPAEFVIEVSTGTPREHERGIIVLPILSRTRYERFGHVFYPQYESMFADNDFCESARLDGVVIDARGLMFPHRHPLFDASVRKPGVAWQDTDTAYSAQNSPEAHRIGAGIYRWRQRNKFGRIERVQETIALCLTGETFNGAYLDAMLTLYGHLVNRDFAVWRAREYTSNVYVTREQIRRVMLGLEPKAELFLWIDDDNPAPTPDQFDRLLSVLDSRPDVDGVFGWCWIYDADKKSFKVSCGQWSPDGVHWRPFDHLFPLETQPREVEASGFPCALLRRSAFDKAGPNAFLPILDDRLEHGVIGEDHAFLHRAQAAGARFLADPTVRVQHLKYCDCEPELPAIKKPAPRVATFLRVKNEARWIARAVASVLELSTWESQEYGVPASHVYVLDDGSTDKTAALAASAGAIVFSSPFAGQGLDECRDKSYMVGKLREWCDPDWILCIDGDEELEPGGGEKILRVLRTDPDVDCFALGVLNLWDRPDTIRTDGLYGTMGRQSLFRVKGVSEVSFKSYYEGLPGAQTHVGLHVSNAPFGLRTQPLHVYLLHYGYLHRADRIRKYRWYVSVDGTNEHEDFYRHTIQGDLPEVPADAVLKHGGPLKLVTMPARMVPQFERVPGPLDGVGRSAAVEVIA